MQATYDLKLVRLSRVGRGPRLSNSKYGIGILDYVVYGIICVLIMCLK